MIWITGGRGFLGQELQRQLPAVLVTSRTDVNLLDLDSVRAHLSRHPFQTIVHAAAHVGGIAFHRDHPGEIAVQNLRMGLNVLEAAAELGGIHVVLVSSACVYSEQARIPTPEEDEWLGQPSPMTAPYGHAKRQVHALAEALARENRLSYSTMIPTNMYGPGDHFAEAKSHVVAALIRRALQTKARGDREFVVWGSGTATRDFLHVTDAARAILLGLQPESHGQSWNVGSGIEVPIRELAETILDLVGFDGELVWDTTKPDGAPRKALDISKIQSHLGFTPQVSLREGLAQTLEWARTRVL